MSGKSTSPSTTASAATDSFLIRTILAPILFISFLISLVLIDRSTSTEVFSHSHAEHDHHHSDRGDPSEHSGDGQYYHSHQRKLMKREMDDAFAMRNRVIAVMMICGAFGVAILGWCGVKVWEVVIPSRG